MLIILSIFLSRLGLCSIINSYSQIIYIDETIICENGATFTKTVPFSGTFDYTPQIIFTMIKIDIEINAQLTFNLDGVTLQDFQVAFSCPTLRVNYLKLYYYALSDQRLQVINNFNMQNPSSQVFSKRDSNAMQGFVVINSLSLTGPLDFSLEITSITAYDITVSLTQNPTKAANLLSLGYQVILGTSECLILTERFIKPGAFESPVKNDLSSYYYMVLFQGIVFEQATSLKIQLKIISTGGQRHRVDTWVGVPNGNTHQGADVRISAYTITGSEYTCFTIRISRKEIKDIHLQPQILIYFDDMNKSFGTLGTFMQEINQQINPVLFFIQCKCSPGKKIKAEFNKCSTCGSNKSYIQYQSCYNNKQIITFYPKYNSIMNLKGNLKIELEDNKITITQLLFNHVATQVVIARVQFIDL